MKITRATVCFAAIVLVPTAALGVTVTDAPSQICNLIPKDTQGVNGIRLQYRAVGTSDYTDLTYLNDNEWGTPGVPFNEPSVRLLSPGKWLVHPSAVVQCWYNRDAVIRVKIEGSATSIRIAGEVGTDFSSSVSFYIYKGAGNWAPPIWSGGPGQLFSVTNSCQDGDELFFATNAGDNDFYDWAFYKDVTITGLEFQPQTAPTLSIRVSQVELCWDTRTNAWYQLQYRSTLTTNQWLPLSGAWLVGTGGTYCTNDTVLVGQAQRFYQVAVTNSPP